MKALFPYPGAKFLLSEIIVRILRDPTFSDATTFREPFAGTGAVSLRMSRHMPCWLNDKDPAIYTTNIAQKFFPERLSRAVDRFDASEAAWRGAKKSLFKCSDPPQTPAEIVQTALNKIVAHRLAFNGNGLDCGPRTEIAQRWNVDSIKAAIWSNHRRLAKAYITNLDFTSVIDDETEIAKLYLDPPYLWARRFYHCRLEWTDHLRLCDALRRTKHAWLLSYDDCEEIREMYDWACITAIPTRYASTNRYTKELLISNRNIGPRDVQ